VTQASTQNPELSHSGAGVAGLDPADRYFELSLFGLLAIGFITLASTGRMDTITMAIMGLALTGRAILLLRGSEFRLSPDWVRRLTLAYLPFWIFDGLFLQSAAVNMLERWLLALIHFVFFAAVIELFSARRTRDYIFLAALAFAQMLAASTLTVGTAFLVCFGIFLFLSISTFTSLEIRRSRDRFKGFRPEVPLGGKRAGLAAALGATSVIICVGVIFLSFVLFFVIPRANQGYFSALSRPSDQMTGFSDDVELGQIGEIKRSSRVVMHVDASGLQPDDGVKWRGIALTTFDGKRWFNDTGSVMAVPGRRSFRFSQAPIHPGAPPRLLNYAVTLEPIASDSVFLAPQPIELMGPFRNLWQDKTGSVYMPSNSGALVRYTVVSDVAVPAPEALQSEMPEVPPDIQQTYLQMPKSDPRTIELARQITGPFATSYEKVRALESHLQTNYGYTLDMPPALPDDPIAYFLFESRSGHCEFFASSMAVMLRAVGIPARLVNGFLQGQYNEISGQYTVRASDAHTWVEVYFPEHGWVSFDPTPASGRIAQEHWLGRTALYLDAFQTFWQEWVINYDFLHQVTLARQVESTSRRMRGDARDYLRDHYRSLVASLRQNTNGVLQQRGWLAFGVILMTLCGIVIYNRSGLLALFGNWSLHRRARRGQLRPRDATVLYSRFLRLFARRGFRKAPAQTPNEFAESVPEPARPLVRDFTRLYLETRFGSLTGSIPRMASLLTQIQEQTRSNG
jgi:transglutaminase-like putative cysteine protease